MATQMGETPSPTWLRQGVACAQSSAPAQSGCDAGLVCAGSPPTGFTQQLCVWTTESVASCPDGYGAMYSYNLATGYTDNRTCVSNSCACDASVTCTLEPGSVTAYPGDASYGCSSGGTALANLGLQDGSTNCNQNLSTLESITSVVTAAGGCTATGTASSTGEVVENSPAYYTVCCAN